MGPVVGRRPGGVRVHGSGRGGRSELDGPSRRCAGSSWRHRADDREPIRLPRQHREMFADPHSRRGRLDRPKRSANVERGVRLRVPRLKLARTAPLKNQDARLRAPNEPLPDGAACARPANNPGNPRPVKASVPACSAASARHARTAEVVAAQRSFMRKRGQRRPRRVRLFNLRSTSRLSGSVTAGRGKVHRVARKSLTTKMTKGTKSEKGKSHEDKRKRERAMKINDVRIATASLP